MIPAPMSRKPKKGYFVRGQFDGYRAEPGVDAGATTVNEGLLSLITSGALASGNNVVINATTAASLATLVLGAGIA